MTAAGQPTLHVYLDDGTGTFPYDVSAYVVSETAYSITRGRSDELATVQPGTLSLRLDNTDGRFTLGSTIIAAPSPIKIDQKIRVSVTVGATTSNRFTGFVQSWPVDWPDGLATYSTAQVTAVDASARWSRRTLGTIIGETYLADAPTAYYPMGEPSGAVAASDVSGNGQPELANAGTGTAVIFGQDTGPSTDGLTAATLPASGQYMLATGMTPYGSTNAIYGECFFRASSTPAGPLFLLDMGGAGANFGPAGGAGALFLNPTGTLRFVTTGAGTGVTGATNICDGRTHHIAGVYAGTTVTIYVDGVSDGASVVGTGLAASYTMLAIGTLATVASGTPIVISHVAVGTTISAARIAAHAAAGLTGFVETSDLRIDRLIGYEGTLTSTVGDTGQVTVPSTDITGKTVTDAVQQVVDAEVGLLWINGDGAATYANKDHVALATTPAMTIPISSGLIEDGAGFSVDMQQVSNYVTGQREGDDGTQVVTSPTSITAHGTYATSQTWLVQSDVEVLSRAQWLVTKYAEPAPRLPSLGLDLLTAAAADQILCLGLDLDSHIKVTGWPSQSPGGSSTDLVVEGYTETLSDTAWDLSLNCASWTQQSAGILDDAGYGVLDTMTLGI